MNNFFIQFLWYFQSVTFPQITFKLSKIHMKVMKARPNSNYFHSSFNFSVMQTLHFLHVLHFLALNYFENSNHLIQRNWLINIKISSFVLNFSSGFWYDQRFLDAIIFWYLLEATFSENRRDIDLYTGCSAVTWVILFCLRALLFKQGILPVIDGLSCQS